MKLFDKKDRKLARQARILMTAFYLTILSLVGWQGFLLLRIIL